MGKGRQIAALVRQHAEEGGTRVLWLSVSTGEFPGWHLVRHAPCCNTAQAAFVQVFSCCCHSHALPTACQPRQPAAGCRPTCRSAQGRGARPAGRGLHLCPLPTGNTLGRGTWVWLANERCSSRATWCSFFLANAGFTHAMPRISLVASSRSASWPAGLARKARSSAKPLHAGCAAACAHQHHQPQWPLVLHVLGSDSGKCQRWLAEHG